MSKISHISFQIILLAAWMLFAASCRKDAGSALVYLGEGEPVGFSVYSAGSVRSAGESSSSPTKGPQFSSDSLLGHWEDSTYIPGVGVGVFAFYQPAKSNGQPNDFRLSMNGPDFMYNQKLERTSSDGLSFDFTYSPLKYWPNNVNDQLSFFAYAPYDSTACWEDLHLIINSTASEIRRSYSVDSDPADQKDFIWADPVLNQQKPASGALPVQLNFRHLCARMSVSSRVNLLARAIYVTVDTVSITGAFNTSGTFVYTSATGQSAWRGLSGSDVEKTYWPYRASYTTDTTGTTTYETFVVDTVTRHIPDESGYIFVLPGTQDITLTAVVSQRSASTSWYRSYEITRTFPSMLLEGNKAYNFLLNVTLTPVNFTGHVNANWSTSTETYTSSDHGQTWTH